MTRIRRASPTVKDALHFTVLMYISAPEYFPHLLGKHFHKFFFYEFLTSRGIFSHKYVYFATVKRHIAGMILSYGYANRRKEQLFTALHMMYILKWDFFRNIPIFVSSERGSGHLQEGEYYISNVAVYKRLRGKKIGKVPRHMPRAPQELSITQR